MELSNDQMAVLSALINSTLMIFIIWSHLAAKWQVLRIIAKFALLAVLFAAGRVIDIPDASHVSWAVMTLSWVTLVTVIFLFVAVWVGPGKKSQT